MDIKYQPARLRPNMNKRIIISKIPLNINRNIMRANDNIRIKKDHIRMIKNLISMSKEGKITNLNTNKNQFT